MKKVTVYTAPSCPYCIRAKSLLQSKNIPFEEVKLTWEDLAPWKELEARTGMKTVPQIFIGDQLVGGFTELDGIDRSGELAKLLQ